MKTTYYAIFASAKGSKDLVQIVESSDYASYLTGKYHMQNPSSNYKVWKSDKGGFINTFLEQPIIINGEIVIGKGAQ